MRKLLMCGIGAEILLFVLLYYAGPNGTHILSQLLLEKSRIEREVFDVHSEIDQLSEKIKNGHTAFAKEKIARERLLMKKKDETVYFIKKSKVENV